MSLFPGLSINKKTILFITGAGHSGSTILSKALTMHSRIFSIGEIDNFEEDLAKSHAICGCSELIHTCGFWTEIDGALKMAGNPGIKENPSIYNFRRIHYKKFHQRLFFKVSLVLALIFRIYSRFLKVRIKHIRILYDSLFHKSEVHVIVDSSKSARRAFFISNKLRKQYKFLVVHLCRDGRAVLGSYQKGYYYLGNTKYTGLKRSVDESIRIWMSSNLSSLVYNKWFRHQPYHFLNYENFAANPSQELKTITGLLGLEYEPSMLKLTARENHMVCGNASRINAFEIEPPSEAWRESMDHGTLQRFMRKAGWLNRHFGYR